VQNLYADILVVCCESLRSRPYL